jgi:murein DD-endopeptidase MepM/ murein hydrolase activator NlpD
MSREKRRGGPVLLAGLGGFALGAATVLVVVWAYGVRPPGAPGGEVAATPASGAPRTTEAPATPASPTAPGARGRAGAAGPRGGGPSPEPGFPGAGTSAGSGAAPGAAPPAVAADVDALGRRHLLLPVQGVQREQLRDSFSDGRAGHVHEALDIMAARNTPVMAVEDGRLAKLFVSAQGGNTIYQFDPAATYAYYYAHLERYADGLHEGDQLRRGQVIGYVGTSGNAPPNAPHLHFAIFRLTPERQWWKGTAVDPYLVFTQP